MANTIDNFTHGLAVAASFLVSRKVSARLAGCGVGGRGRLNLQCDHDARSEANSLDDNVFLSGVIF